MINNKTIDNKLQQFLRATFLMICFNILPPNIKIIELGKKNKHAPTELTIHSYIKSQSFYVILIATLTFLYVRCNDVIRD